MQRQTRKKRCAKKHDKFVTACKKLKIRLQILLVTEDICVVSQNANLHLLKSQRSHELKHTPPVVISEDVQPDTYFEDKHEDFDDMFSYQKALMEYGMLVANLRDAISEGTYISSQYIQHTLNTQNLFCVFVYILITC